MKHQYSYSTPNHHHHRNHHRPPLQPPLQPPQPQYSISENPLINEVFYLHSLWHRGPPHYNNHSHSHSHFHLKPSHTTHFKKPLPRHVSDKEWPVVITESSLSGSNSGWPAFPSHNKALTRPATAEERGAVLGVKIQQRALDSARSLFKNGDDDVEEEEEYDPDDDDVAEVEFFEELFENDEELREFYKRNCEGVIGREFYCLICENKGKLGRKYRNCGALIQHSMSVAKTRKKKAHRAFGKVVCKLLGWEVDCLPSLPDPVPAVLTDEVNNNGDHNLAVVETQKDDVLAKPSQIETETISDSLGKDNATSTDDGSIAVEQMQVEGENKDNADGHKVDTQNSENNRVCSTSENAMPEQENNPESNREDNSKTVGEGCPVLDSKPVESLEGNDPFEELQSLPGVFQIPE